MNENSILNLSIESSAFDRMRQDFNKILKQTIGNMQVKGSREAQMTLKLSICLTETEVPDYESAKPDAIRIIEKPSFDHKVNSVMQIKAEESGKFNGDYELVWDDNIQDFVLKPIVNSQRSFYDDDFVMNDGDEPYDEDDVKQLPAADSSSASSEAPVEAVGVDDDDLEYEVDDDE